METKVVHVHFFAERKNYYFGSVAAIYDYFTAADVGMTKETLLHAGLSEQSPVMTKKACVMMARLLRSKQGKNKA